jgi:excisionase family DNA binding protein
MSEIESLPELISRQLSYTPRQAAAATGRTRTRIFQALRNKEITGRKDGRSTLIEASELLRWIRSMPAVGRQPS